MRSRLVALVLVVASALAGEASAQPTEPSPPDPAPSASSAPSAPSLASASRRQGLAVVARGNAKEDAAPLARGIYGSSLRPRSLDETQARILTGEPPAAGASKELRELAELRAAVTGEDVASRRLLKSIADQVGVEGLLVLGPAVAAPDGDAGAPAELPAGNRHVRLFLADTGEFDAARYAPDADGTWRGTVASLAASGRFTKYSASSGAPNAASALATRPATLPSENTRPFYKSPWLWGALGAAVLIGGFVFFAAQGTDGDPIQVQMRVPR